MYSVTEYYQCIPGKNFRNSTVQNSTAFYAFNLTHRSIEDCFINLSSSPSYSLSSHFQGGVKAQKNLAHRKLLFSRNMTGILPLEILTEVLTGPWYAILILQSQMHLWKPYYLSFNAFGNLCINKVMSHNSFNIQKIENPELCSVGTSVVYQFLKLAGTGTAATRISLDKIMSAEIQLVLSKHVCNCCESRTFLPAWANAATFGKVA